MAKQTINIGSAANDGTGSTLRAAFDITNDNFTELYDGTGGLFHKIEGTNFTGSLLIGHSTTGTISSAQYNTGVGIGALDALTTGDANVAIGYNTGTSISTALNNTLVGAFAGDTITSGSYNVAVGYFALQAEDQHGRNVAIGWRALTNQDAGADAYNVAIGYDAGLAVSTGTDNVLIGGQVADTLTTGSRNVAIGKKALQTEDSGGRNVAIGYQALYSQDSGSDAYNIAIGYDAGLLVSTGIQNTVIGGLAGDTLTEGSNNIVIGYNAAASAVDVSNEVTIGNSSIANVRIPSDSTLKIGASGDLQLEHLSGNSFIKNTAVGDLYIENQVDDGDVIFRCDDGSGGLETYFFLDGSAGGSNPRTIFPDNSRLCVGTGEDLNFTHDGTDTFIQNDSGDLTISNRADDKDIIFQSDNGSGGLATYFFLDGSASQVKFEVDVKLQDNDIFRVGGSDDLKIFHSGTESFIQADGTGNLTIEQKTDDADISFKSDDGSGSTTEYFRLDGSSVQGIVSKPFRFLDSVQAIFGTGNDLKIQHNGTDNFIDSYTGNLNIRNHNVDKDIIFQADDGSGGLATYFYLDGGGVLTRFSKRLRMDDSINLQVGSSGDMSIYHNATDTFIDNATGHLNIRNQQDDGDIIFTADDGSGGNTEYFRLDGGEAINVFTRKARFLDNVQASFGAADDFKISHDGSATYVQNVTSHLIIENQADDSDIIFKSDDGSGGVTEYFKLDGSTKRIDIPDSIILAFGSSDDFKITHDGTNTLLTNETGALRIIQGQDDGDIEFYSDDGSGGLAEYFRVDGGATKTIFSKNLGTNDNIQIQIGAGSDLRLRHDGTDSYIENYTGDFIIKQRTDDGDIKFECDDGSGGTTEYFRVDGGAAAIIISKNVQHADNVKAYFGNAIDLAIYHDSSNSYVSHTGTGDLIIENTTDDKDVIFKSDDGSGGTTTYLTIDGSEVENLFNKKARFPDSVKLTFGGSRDLEIYHDGSNSYIADTGTGSLNVLTNTFSVKNAAGNEAMLNAIQDGAVNLYYNGTGPKLSTESSGVLVTGDLEIANSSDGIILESPNGTRYRVTVDNSGNLSTAAL